MTLYLGAYMSGITNQYRTIGVDNYYKEHAIDYDNPHKKQVIECLSKLYSSNCEKVLDLACGDGLVTKWIKEHFQAEVIGCDKFMAERYKKETGKDCKEYTFQDIASNKSNLDKDFDLIICSYAIDLVPKSYMSNLLWELAQISEHLLIIRPNNHILENNFWDVENKAKEGKAKAVLYKRKF